MDTETSTIELTENEIGFITKAISEFIYRDEATEEEYTEGNKVIIKLMESEF